MFNGSAALGAWALAGPIWAGMAFMAIALVRVALEAQYLRDQNGELRRRLLLNAEALGGDDFDVPADSETRPSQTAVARAAGGAD
jgi:hypothetical protein